MFKNYTNRFKTLSILIISALLLISLVASTGMVNTIKAEASYTSAAKPMQFYFHHLANPVTVAGLETKYIMNTTRNFSFSTQQEAYANSFFKAVGPEN